MKKSLFWLMSICAFLSVGSIQAHACPPSKDNPQRIDYMKRDHDSRCEGLIPPNRSARPELVSLNIGRITALSNPLKLQVPNYNNQNPTVLVRSFAKDYQLDSLTLRKQNSYYQFQWDNNVIKNAQIEPDSLRAIAYIDQGRLVYLPVLLSPRARQYDIVLLSPDLAKITDFKILKDNQVIYGKSLNGWQPKGEIFFSWNGRTTQGQPAHQGLYQLQITYQLKQQSQPQKINASFVHNPQWLR